MDGALLWIANMQELCCYVLVFCQTVSLVLTAPFSPLPSLRCESEGCVCRS